MRVEIDGRSVVVAVLPGSPAERAGLAEGDLITAIDGTPAGNAAELRAAIEAIAEGAAYTLTIDRGGASPDARGRARGSVRRQRLAGGTAAPRSRCCWPCRRRRAGPDVPPSLLGEMAEETADGLRVFAVFPGSPADVGGVRPGDLLVSVAGRALTTLADLEALMRSFNPTSGKVEVVLLRDGEELTLEIDLAVGGIGGGGAATQ